MHSPAYIDMLAIDTTMEYDKCACTINYHAMLVSIIDNLLVSYVLTHISHFDLQYGVMSDLLELNMHEYDEMVEIPTCE